MARFRTLEEIIISMLNFSNATQPDANMAPGTVLRDLTVDMPSIEIAKIYDESRVKAGFQALLSATGSELDKWGANFGIPRLSGTNSTGTIIATTNALNSNILIALNSTVTARNGQSFRVTNAITMDATKASIYRSVAVRYSTQLQLAGILDQYAVEVPVSSISTGISTNIGKNQISSHNISGISNVTNLSVFSGGSSIENDVSYRNRLLSVFRGAATGTETAYLATVTADSRVISADIVGPGDLLMQRDGTIVQTTSDGVDYVATPGSGGKVDILIQGKDLISNSESFIYNDKSGKLDATDPRNDYLLGQRASDSLLDFPQKRLQAQKTGLYPFQPVTEVLSISGSLSGPNFKPVSVDEFGNKTGNFELVKDTSAYTGSAFGSDKIHFISNSIALDKESITKPQLHSTDPLDFSGVLGIDAITQTLSITREVATVSTDRQFVYAQHTPFYTVEKVVNKTTGERYRVISSNPDGVVGALNTTGKIQISGATLPRENDIVEISYNWEVSFDPDVDFDSLKNPSRTRTAIDSVDWGHSSEILLEETVTLFSGIDGYHILTDYPINKVKNVSTYLQESIVESAGKLVLSTNILNILSVKDSVGKEVFFTDKNDGSVSGKTIRLPSDSLLLSGATAVIRYNTVDLFSPELTDNGTYSGNKIVLTTAITPSTPVLVDYIASFYEVVPAAQISSLPIVASLNQFAVNGSIVGEQPVGSAWVSSTRGKLERFSPCFLRFASSNIPASGRFQITGKTLKHIQGFFVYTGLVSGTIELNNYIQSLGLSGEVVKIKEFSKVTVSSGTIVSKNYTFSMLNYELKNNKFSNAILNNSLNSTSFALASTNANISNAPTTGNFVYVDFYLMVTETERLAVSASGDQYTKNKYFYVDEIRVESGFRNTSNVLSGTLSVYGFNQPASNSQYFVDYDFTAPKVGERITISYNYNSLMADLVKRLDKTRPIGADVLVKSKSEFPVYVSMTVAPLASYTGSTVSLQNSIQQKISTFINQLNSDELDLSDLINVAYSVSGVDRVIITQLNATNSTGIMQTIKASVLSYFVASSVEIIISSK